MCMLRRLCAPARMATEGSDADAGGDAEAEAEEEEEGMAKLSAVLRQLGDGAGHESAPGQQESVVARFAPLVRQHAHPLASRAHGQLDLAACGSGLFPLSAALAHSCLPCAASGFDAASGLLVTRAVAEIAPGDEVSVSFIDTASGFVGAARRDRHSNRYRATPPCRTCAPCGCRYTMSPQARPPLRPPRPQLPLPVLRGAPGLGAARSRAGGARPGLS